MMICFQFCFFLQFLTVKGGHDPEQILAVPPQFGLLFESHKHQMVLSIEATTAGSIDLQHKTAPFGGPSSPCGSPDIRQRSGLPSQLGHR